jgi:hypothetical protein
VKKEEHAMSSVKTVDKSRNGRNDAHERLTPENAVLLLVDHQSGLVSGVRDLEPDEVRHNVVAFARRAPPAGPGCTHLDCARDVGPDSA